MFDSWQQDSTRRALPYAIINYVTMTAPMLLEAFLASFDVPFNFDIFSDALFARSSKHMNVLGRLLDPD